jgi:hypothetical protein
MCCVLLLKSASEAHAQKFNPVLIESDAIPLPLIPKALSTELPEVWVLFEHVSEAKIVYTQKEKGVVDLFTEYFDSKGTKVLSIKSVARNSIVTDFEIKCTVRGALVKILVTKSGGITSASFLQIGDTYEFDLPLARFDEEINGHHRRYLKFFVKDP